MKSSLDTLHSTKPDPFFVAEDKALDFLNSVCAPFGELIDWLSDGDELLNWIYKAELIDAQDVVWFLDHTSVEERNQSAQKAAQLRELFRDFINSYHDKPFDNNALSMLQEINCYLKADRQFIQIAPELNDQTIILQKRRHWQSSDDLLSVLAVAMAKCVSNVDFERVKKCENHSCTLWFYDTSKNAKRRWCTMSICGNRAKAAAYRQRQKKQ